MREYTGSSLWLLPPACAVLALIVGVLLSLVDVGSDSPLAFQGLQPLGLRVEAALYLWQLSLI